MKYKVLLRNQTSGRSGLAEASFYRLAQAQNCAQGWVELVSENTSYLWDGENWTIYAPIP